MLLIRSFLVTALSWVWLLWSQSISRQHWVREFTPDGKPVHCRASFAHTCSRPCVSRPSTCLFLDSGRKPEKPEETQEAHTISTQTVAQAQGQTQDPRAVRWQFYPLCHHTMQLYCSSNHFQQFLLMHIALLSDYSTVKLTEMMLLREWGMWVWTPQLAIFIRFS